MINDTISFGGHDPCQIANEFIQMGIDREEPITPLEVQKLIYFAHGWTLANHNRPLHHDEWEAWPYGPVLSVVYHRLSYYRGDPVDDIILAHDMRFEDYERRIIDDVYDGYRHMGGVRLSRLTHVKGGPWDQVKKKRWGSRIIPNETIRKYFIRVSRKIEAMNG
ncbi:MAG: DUF4065 domain-containing protein [Chloroflexi bacterium]|nr:DUF4065 domain-containing protein [Chloroflexota bacterium]